MTAEGRAARYRGIRVLEVLRTEQVARRMRRIVLGGAEIEGFGDGPNIKLLIPPAGLSPPKWPLADREGRPIWPADGQRPAVRTFSARRFNSDGGELTVDFACHGGDGPAAQFARRARPGDLVGVGGPGGRTLPDADFHLLVGDECGLPSIASILERLPGRARGTCFIEVDDEEDCLPLEKPVGMEVAWLMRRGAAPGTTRLLADAVVALDGPCGAGCSAWIAAESASVRTIRSHLVRDRGMPHAALVAIGYWKRGLCETAYDAAHRHDRDCDEVARP
ncbi:siderophore-interacting protein [Xanthobacter sp. 126]|uniref:siderophore-interacting protein n=1 Tax=Xanthobacter sp. 126 TaxID=1131814 RepID=UPI00045E7B27|nr:siderophore-interacting protein [Xanthobacter sp. 126]